jgi:hypothetical protein
MSDDLDLLHRYFNGHPEDLAGLEVARQDLQDAIDAETGADGQGLEGPSLTPRRIVRRHRIFAVAGGAGTAAAAALLVVFLLPSVGQHEPLAAAAELRQIAANASTRTPAQLGRGQLLLTEVQVSLLGQVTQIGSSPTPAAQATVNGTIKEWSDAYGDSCISSSSGPAQFASPANLAAWKAAGMLESPTGQPAISCTNAGYPVPGGAGVIDVASLPTDSSTLARELRTGTTGIPLLDQVTPGQSVNPGFERAAFLLIGPTTGATPAFSGALYNALALIPDIHILGNMASHSGQAGVGFSGSSNAGTSVIIVDPSTGALLEARNLQSPGAFLGLGPDYVAPAPTPSILTEGGGSKMTIQWVDPIGSPTVVNASSLPPDISVPAPVISAGTIVATAKLDSTQSQLTALASQLIARFGDSVSYGYTPSAKDAAAMAVPPTMIADGTADTPAVMNWNFGSTTQTRNYLAALKASGLFTSLNVTYGSGHASTIRSAGQSATSFDPSVVRDVTTVPASVYNAVGVPSNVSPPIVLSSQPPLTLRGKSPAVFYDGAEYCPYCAADRWALTAALSRFGTWSNLELISSSTSDVDPNTHTFSYHGATYSSPFLAFSGVEQYSSVPSNGGYRPLDELTKEEQAVLNTYATPTYIPGAQADSVGLPFIDIGNVALISGASFNPGVLAGMTWTDIAGHLTDPSNPATRQSSELPITSPRPSAPAPKESRAQCATPRG